ncbi:MAG: squalene--hopene cyclase [Pirellulaceae bacterium]
MARAYPTLHRLSRWIATFCLVGFCLGDSSTYSQLDQLEVHEGAGIPHEVELIYERGADYLAKAQSENGSWTTNGNFHGDEACGICALSVMAFLSTGEDPNFGKYARNIRAAIRYIIENQNAKTGYIPGNMYVHGFSMLALAEAYGAVDENMLWAGEDVNGNNKRRTIGEALELCVRLAVTAQKKNPNKGWRYSPGDPSADTSIVGAVLMGLLAARNAGIDVPDESIDGALNYMKGMTSDSSGEVGYSGLGGLGESGARSSIACLVFSIGKRKEWKELEATRKYLVDHLLTPSNTSWPQYERYYKAQRFSKLTTMPGANGTTQRSVNCAIYRMTTARLAKANMGQHLQRQCHCLLLRSIIAFCPFTNVRHMPWSWCCI